MCYIRALFLTIPLAVVAAAVVLLLHFSSHFIHCESTCGILKYSEAKNGQIYLKTVMRMNITVSVNKSFFYNMECGDMCLCLFSSVSLVSLLASIFVALCRSLHSWKCRNLWVCKVEYEKRLHNIKLSPSRPCVCVCALQTVAYFNHSIEFIEMTCCGPILDIWLLCGPLWGQIMFFDLCIVWSWLQSAGRWKIASSSWFVGPF